MASVCSPMRGTGSGIILDTAGHVVTNSHVVERAAKVKVTLWDGQEVPAKVVGTAFAIRGPMRAIALGAGAAGLVFVAVMIVGDGGNPDVFGPIGHGGAERMIVYPAMLWLLAFGGYLIGHDRHVPGSDPSTLG